MGRRPFNTSPERYREDLQKQRVIVKAVAQEELRRARTDYASIRLRRHKEARDAKQRLADLCSPFELYPDSEWTPETLTQLPTYYLVVAAVKNQLLSVTDARVSFALNKWTRSREGGASWPPLRSCFLAYESPIEAIAAGFPRHSELAHAPKILMRVLAQGQAYHHRHSGAWALSQVKPVDLVTQFSLRAPLDVHYALNPVSDASVREGRSPIRQSARASVITLPHSQTSIAGDSDTGTAALPLTHRPRSPLSPRVRAALQRSDPSWSPPVAPASLVSARTADIVDPSPPRRPFVPAAAPPPPARGAGAAQGAAVKARDVAAGVPSGRDRDSVGALLRDPGAHRVHVQPRSAPPPPPPMPPGNAPVPNWLLQSVPEHGAEAFAARFHDNRPLKERVNVPAGINQLYGMANLNIDREMKRLDQNAAAREPVRSHL